VKINYSHTGFQALHKIWDILIHRFFPHFEEKFFKNLEFAL
jgi:hypothetical protein